MGIINEYVLKNQRENTSGILEEDISLKISTQGLFDKRSR